MGDLKFIHTGDLGDIIAALPILRHLGGGILYIAKRPGVKEMTETRFNAMKALVEIQPYIRAVEWYDEQTKVDLDFSDFRQVYNDRIPLTLSQANWAEKFGFDMKGLDIETAWLTFPEPIPYNKHGHIAVIRTDRYNSGSVHWQRLVNAKHQHLKFIGLPHEYHRFCGEFCKDFAPIQYAQTHTLLEVAKEIANSRLLIANQTSGWWIGEGLKHPNMIQESRNEHDDSFIARPGSRHCPPDFLSLHEILAL